jgi:putative ABC transport system ATP-binding protein
LNADGQTIVVVTHNTELARSCTRRTVRLVDGRITSDVTSEAAAHLPTGVAESETAR